MIQPSPIDPPQQPNPQSVSEPPQRQEQEQLELESGHDHEHPSSQTQSLQTPKTGRRNHKWTTAENQLVESLYDSGKRAPQIAKLLPHLKESVILAKICNIKTRRKAERMSISSPHSTSGSPAVQAVSNSSVPHVQQPVASKSAASSTVVADPVPLEISGDNAFKLSHLHDLGVLSEWQTNDGKWFILVKMLPHVQVDMGQTSHHGFELTFASGGPPVEALELAGIPRSSINSRATSRKFSVYLPAPFAIDASDDGCIITTWPPQSADIQAEYLIFQMRRYLSPASTSSSKATNACAAAPSGSILQLQEAARILSTSTTQIQETGSNAASTSAAPPEAESENQMEEDLPITVSPQDISLVIL